MLSIICRVLCQKFSRGVCPEVIVQVLRFSREGAEQVLRRFCRGGAEQVLRFCRGGAEQQGSRGAEVLQRRC